MNDHEGEKKTPSDAPSYLKQKVHVRKSDLCILFFLEPLVFICWLFFSLQTLDAGFRGLPMVVVLPGYSLRSGLY